MTNSCLRCRTQRRGFKKKDCQLWWEVRRGCQMSWLEIHWYSQKEEFNIYYRNSVYLWISWYLWHQLWNSILCSCQLFNTVQHTPFLLNSGWGYRGQAEVAERFLCYSLLLNIKIGLWKNNVLFHKWCCNKWLAICKKTKKRAGFKLHPIYSLPNFLSCWRLTKP